MKKCIVDASVIAAAFFRETISPQARELLASRGKLHAPDLIYSEVANVIWKRHARDEIDEKEARALLSDILTLPLKITPSRQLVESALALATRTKRTVYDCLYLALAARNRSVMFTADKRLVNALAKTPLEQHLSWIGDFH
ncbi:MAG: type II toxin-antitoxin system VapC family toxin [Phycisphaerae bacterium]|nr:type II toxin-antitoxin system VapC family toxin [Phycisphaerae bacterium]